MIHLKTNEKEGFTLIEILVALLIFSIIVTTLFSSFRAFLVSSDTLKTDVNESWKLRSVFNRMRLDLLSVYSLRPPRYKKPGFDSPPDPYRFEGKEETVGKYLVSSLAFASAAHTGYGGDDRTGVARIEYYMKKNEDDTCDLYRADRLYPFSEDVRGCADPVLCENVTGFEAAYTDFDGETHRQWDSDSEEFEFSFPSSVHVKVIIGSGENKQVLETSFHLPGGRRPLE